MKEEDRKSLNLARIKFTPAQILRMRKAREDGLSNEEIGRRFGCSGSMVARLLRAK